MNNTGERERESMYDRLFHNQPRKRRNSKIPQVLRMIGIMITSPVHHIYHHFCSTISFLYLTLAHHSCHQ